MMNKVKEVNVYENYEYKEYLKEEGKCGVYREGNSLEIYNEDEDSSDGMVVLKIKEKDLY